jgi:hypothetical protein
MELISLNRTSRHWDKLFLLLKYGQPITFFLFHHLTYNVFFSLKLRDWNVNIIKSWTKLYIFQTKRTQRKLDKILMLNFLKKSCYFTKLTILVLSLTILKWKENILGPLYCLQGFWLAHRRRNQCQAGRQPGDLLSCFERKKELSEVQSKKESVKGSKVFYAMPYQDVIHTYRN